MVMKALFFSWMPPSSFLHLLFYSTPKFTIFEWELFHSLHLFQLLASHCLLPGPPEWISSECCASSMLGNSLCTHTLPKKEWCLWHQTVPPWVFLPSLQIMANCNGQCGMAGAVHGKYQMCNNFGSHLAFWDHHGLLHRGAVWTSQHTATWWHCLVVLKVLTARLAASKKKKKKGHRYFHLNTWLSKHHPVAFLSCSNDVGQLAVSEHKASSSTFRSSQTQGGTGCLASRSYTAKCSPGVGSYIWRWSRWRLWCDCKSVFSTKDGPWCATDFHCLRGGTWMWKKVLTSKLEQTSLQWENTWFPELAYWEATL